MEESLLTVQNVTHCYPDKDDPKKHNIILNNINLGIGKGEIVGVVGPTGCGKTTLLKLIIGSEKPFQGFVYVNGKEVKGPGIDRGVVFQRYTLFPDRTVEENVMFGLEVREFYLLEPIWRPFRWWRKRKEFREQADHILGRVGLLEDRKKYPYELSGGMRQRVAIAKAMVLCPPILLMDEPFGALDFSTREKMQLFLIEQWQYEHQTTILVSHDLEEVLYLSTRVIVVSPYYSNDDGSPSEGSKIVMDVPINWKFPRPMDIKHSPEFNDLQLKIKRIGLDPEYRQKVQQFDIRHTR
ncbi:MAG: ABC transporter ATP-binding protein [Candidatus Poribacteria bacterium]